MENAMHEDVKRKLADEINRNGAINHGPYPGAPTAPHQNEAAVPSQVIANGLNPHFKPCAVPRHVLDAAIRAAKSAVEKAHLAHVEAQQRKDNAIRTLTEAQRAEDERRSTLRDCEWLVAKLEASRDA